MPDLTEVAQPIAAFVTAVAMADEAERRGMLTGLYKELQAAGLTEPAAAAIQHQIAQAGSGLGLATHTAQAGGAFTPSGDVTVTKE